jgi:hypothetical protein
VAHGHQGFDMNKLMDYLAFRAFITPYARQFLFWSGIGATLYGTWWLYTQDNWAWTMSLIFGLLVTRLIFENLILKYRTYLCLKEVRDKLYGPPKEA